MFSLLAVQVFLGMAKIQCLKMKLTAQKEELATGIILGVLYISLSTSSGTQGLIVGAK